MLNPVAMSMRPQLSPEAIGFLTRLAASIRVDQPARPPVTGWGGVYGCTRCTACGGLGRQVCMRCGTRL